MAKHIDLTTPFDPGSFDTVLTSYPDLKLEQYMNNIPDQRLDAFCRYGEWTASWADGKQNAVHQITGSNYTTVMALAATASEATDDHLERAILEELITMGMYAGTVADGG